MSTPGESGFTEAVRQELARQPLGSADEQRAELAGIVRSAGNLTVVGGRPPRRRLEVVTSSGAVARRTFALLQARYGVRAQLAVQRPGGVRRRSTYRVAVDVEAGRIAEDLGIVAPTGSPLDPSGSGAGSDAGSAPVDVARLRGALLGAGSVSAPGRAAHLELVAASDAAAAVLAELVRRHVGGTVGVDTGDRPRVVLKSGVRISGLLRLVGAESAAVDLDERRRRRRLRNDANRLANADAANLRRTIEAAASQVGAVERAVQVVGWDALDDDLRSVALARLANPSAPLSELGQLVDPPIGKSAVHRRLRRLEQLARDGAGADRGSD